MKWFADNLWELIRPRRPRRPARPVAARPRRAAGGRPPTAMQQRYDALVADMKKEYGIRVRKWRGSTSGCAWMIWYADGTSSRLIESPYPRGPMSCAVFLHEVGHHAIGLGTYRPRCLEEYHAWRWSLETMRARGFNVTPAVEKRMRDSLVYAVEKARRRGLKRVPAELGEYAAVSSQRSAISPKPRS